MNIVDLKKSVQRKLGVDVDGEDGPQTWGAIAHSLGVETEIISQSSEVSSELASIAESQLGTQEDSKHTNRGAAILKYQEATNLEGQGWPWCAAFVDWCLQQFLAAHMEFARMGLKRAQTAAAFGLIIWGKEQGCHVFNPIVQNPERGDIVVYRFSHCGIVGDVDPERRTFTRSSGTRAITTASILSSGCRR
jgi:hypothetical protein